MIGIGIDLQLADLARAQAGSPEPELAQALIDAWPPLTPNLHTLDFDGGQVRLMLAFVDDATSRVQHLRFVPSESTFDYFRSVRAYIEAQKQQA